MVNHNRIDYIYLKDGFRFSYQGANGNWDATYSFIKGSIYQFGYEAYDVTTGDTDININSLPGGVFKISRYDYSDNGYHTAVDTAPNRTTGYTTRWTLNQVVIYYWRDGNNRWDYEDASYSYRSTGGYSAITDDSVKNMTFKSYNAGESISYNIFDNWRIDFVFTGTDSINTYTITYNINQGSGTTPSSTTATHNTSFTNFASYSGITRSGYDALGWNTSSSSTSALTSITITQNITLYIVWSPHTFTIQYNNNGGSGTMLDSIFTYPTQAVAATSSFTPPSYSGTNATFMYWYQSDGNGFSSYSGWTDTTTLTIYAAWGYTLTYNMNGGSGSVPSETARINYSWTLKSLPSGSTRTGYSGPLGWGTSSSSTSTITTINISGPTTVYAVWSINVYTVTYNKNDAAASGTMTNTAQNYPNNVTIASSSFTAPTGKIFVRWYTTQSGTGGTAYAPAFVISGWVNNTTLALYALWGYTITFNLNGGTGTQPTSINEVSGVTVTLPSVQGITKSGYTAIGWGTSQTSSSPLASYSMPASNTTLYIVWSLDPIKLYHISFSANDAIPENKYVQNILTKANITTNSNRSCIELINSLTTTVNMTATNVNSYKYATLSFWYKYDSAFQKENSIIYEYDCISGSGLTYNVYYTSGVNRYFNDDVNWFINQVPSHTGVTTDGTNEATLSGNVIPLNDSWEYYSVEWFGYFLPNETGVWTFWTVSDDASYLWIGDSAKIRYTTANATVNNGGLHGNQERSGTATLTSGTYYPIRIQFGENGGGDNMTVSFKSPSGTRTYNGSGFWFVNENFQICTEQLGAKLVFKINNNTKFSYDRSSAWTYIAWNYRTYNSEQHFIRINTSNVFTYNSVNLSPTIARHYLGHANNNVTININDFRIICEDNLISNTILNQIYNLDPSYNLFLANNTSYTTPIAPNTRLGYNFITWSDGAIQLNASTLYTFTSDKNKTFKAIWDDKYLGKIFDVLIINGGNNYSASTTLTVSATNTSAHPTITVNSVTKTSLNMGNNAYMFAFDDNNPTGTMNFSQNTVCDILLVGGGGGTPTDHGVAWRHFGGGGAGAIVFIKSVILNGAFTFSRGAAGVYGSYYGTVPTNGGDSVINNGSIDILKAIGGGSGIGANGGCGGGGGLVSINATAGKLTGGSNLILNSISTYNNVTGNTYGNLGGDGNIGNRYIFGGGGGGAGKIGGSNFVTGEQTADGGDGICEATINNITYKFVDLYGKFYGVDDDYNWNTYFGGGGGGSGGSDVYDWQMPRASKKGGKGGGGNGAIFTNTQGVHGLPNTGSGGGGSGTWWPFVIDGTFGGTGIIMVRYYVNQLPTFTPIITNGVITKVNITNIGNGYATTPPNITLNNVGSGSGASLQAVIGNPKTLSVTDIKNRFAPTASGEISVMGLYSSIGLTAGTELSLQSLKGR